MTVHPLGISRHTLPQSLRLPQDIVFVLLPVVSLLCRLLPFEFVRTLSLSPADDVKLTTATSFTSSLCLDDYLRHFYFQSSNVCSALVDFLVLMRYINSLFTYFTYLR